MHLTALDLIALTEKKIMWLRKNSQMSVKCWMYCKRRSLHSCP